MDSREVPRRCPGAPVHVLVPGDPEDFASVVREAFPRVLPYGMPPFAHGVDLSCSWFACQLHDTRLPRRRGRFSSAPPHRGVVACLSSSPILMAFLASLLTR